MMTHHGESLDGDSEAIAKVDNILKVKLVGIHAVALSIDRDCKSTVFL